ncbi:Protein kinase domain [Pelomyxa schiedti]|nr:Protein kinase domain [Pelomyxa schiedti]
MTTMKHDEGAMRKCLQNDANEKSNRGVWVKSVSAPSQPLRIHSQSTPEEEEVKSRSCVMKKVTVTLERHNIEFEESVCSLCPLDKVVKMAVEKQFGLDENQQVISLSSRSHSETTLSASPSLSLSQLVSPKRQIPGEDGTSFDHPTYLHAHPPSLHRQNFMHRDLSSNNVLFDANGVPKICDFGVSRAMDPQGTTTRLISQGTNRTIGPGTPVYMAPKMATAHYSVKGDMWGFGILMTEMLNGDIVDAPFDSLPLISQANFMNEQRRLLAPQEVEEVKKLCRESRESFIASCLSRRNASVEAVNHLTHSPDSALLHLTDGWSTAAADLVVLVVQSCLSILERNRFPFTVIVKLMLCCCTAIVSQAEATTAGGTVTDDQVNECITQWLNALVPAIHLSSSSH